jgi:hypothetical protein
MLVAEYNGPNVAMNSMALAMPKHKEQAELWFAMRMSLGMDGYLTNEEAARCIREVLYPDPVAAPADPTPPWPATKGVSNGG